MFVEAYLVRTNPRGHVLGHRPYDHLSRTSVHGHEREHSLQLDKKGVATVIIQAWFTRKDVEFTGGDVQGNDDSLVSGLARPLECPIDMRWWHIAHHPRWLTNAGPLLLAACFDHASQGSIDVAYLDGHMLSS